MTSRYDQAGEPALAELAQYAQLYPLPDFVKSAQIDVLTTPPQAVSNYYADAREPFQLPCHNAAATIVSAIFFENKQADINPMVRPMIRERLDTMAAYHRVGGYVEKIRQKHAEMHRASDVPDSAYALVQVTGNQKHRMYPLRNTLEVKAAAEWFHGHLPALRQEFPVDDRERVAKKILAKAAELGAKLLPDVEETLEKCAGRGLNEPVKIADAIRNRLVCGIRVPDAAVAILQKLASTVEARPQAWLEPSMTRDLVRTLDQFDRMYGLLNKYSMAVPSPEDAVHGITRSRVERASKRACTTLTGTMYGKEDFTKLSMEDLVEAFGPEIACELGHGLQPDSEKIAEFVATLPLGDARMFDDLMAAKGIRPLVKDAQHNLTPAAYAAIMASGS